MASDLFKSLPLLDYLVGKEGSVVHQPEEIAVVAVQHLLETTGALFQSFTRLGLLPDHFFVMGKYYSINRSVETRLQTMGMHVLPVTEPVELGTYKETHERECARLWSVFEQWASAKNIKTVIVLDDGGTLIKSVPRGVRNGRQVVGIEQTTSGIEINRAESMPIISVAESAVKRYVEPALVSQAVIRKMRSYVLKYAPLRIGIVGCGNIGKALINDLRHGYRLMVWDNDPGALNSLRDVDHASSVNELFVHCDMVIGATGKDISSPQWLSIAPANRILVSVSSGDIEFKSLLQGVLRSTTGSLGSALDSVVLRTPTGHQVEVLRGGTPINFDNDKHSVQPEYIQLTRALLLSAMTQALRNTISLTAHPGVVKLDATLQGEALTWWRENVAHDKFQFPYTMAQMLQPAFISERSGGMS